MNTAHRHTYLSTVLFSAALLISACSQQPDANPASISAGQNGSSATSTSQKTHAQALQHALDTKPTSATHSGRVLITKSTAGYSYIQVEVGGNPIWLAASRVEVKPGEVISWGDYAIMRDFTSKALNQTFPTILFVSKVIPGSAAMSASKSGRVMSIANGGGYSYLEVESAGVREWLAAPQRTLNVGDEVTWSGGATMSNFSSKALNRTFDKIVFVSGVDVATR